MAFNILVVNPGAGSTRVGLFSDEEMVFEEKLRHSPDELLQFPRIVDQHGFRKEKILKLLESKKVEMGTLHAVVGRGGPFKPLTSGTYVVNEKLIKDIESGNYQSEHPSLLGALIAKEIADSLNINAYFVDPVSIDEFWDPARFSGLKEIKRKALSHALNVRMVAKKTARALNKKYGECNFVIVHLGTGITVAAHLNGKQVDSSNANEDGPFSPQRTGALPTIPLVKLCISSGCDYDVMKKKLNREGGMLSYLGTDDIQEIEQRIAGGDKEAEDVYNAMVYGIAKEVGAYAVVLKGEIDAVIITGGIAHSEKFVSQLKDWISFLCAKFYVYPGEGEMEALALGVLRVLRKEEQAKDYT
ncbi:MAG: butyrate kinase [candidate division WOR-3 bacterium]|nr:MAG: butyrate kinase [candidate division WOR-3 bacterium]